MTIKRMTPQQRAVYALVRRGSVDITLDNARPLHALKRRGLVRFATSYLGVRVALPRRNAATIRAHARQDRLARARSMPRMMHSLTRILCYRSNTTRPARITFNRRSARPCTTISTGYSPTPT